METPKIGSAWRRIIVSPSAESTLASPVNSSSAPASLIKRPFTCLYITSLGQLVMAPQSLF